MKSQPQHLLFGYGSLINSDSRAKTGITGSGFPARIKGLQRSWNVPIKEAGLTAVGVKRVNGKFCNGVLFLVSSDQLEEFDRRELPYGYRRAPLSSSAVTMLWNKQLPTENIWVYLADQVSGPSEECPIAQSYLDVILIGCLEFGSDFAMEFVEKTAGWLGPWLNDRSAPRYQRAISNLPTATAELIDGFLCRREKAAFDRRRNL